MKTAEEIEDDIFKIIYPSDLYRNTTGAIYSGINRPCDSKLEDITIKCIANEVDNATDIQVAYVNVNIYIADKLIGNEHEKDRPRCRTLSKLAEEIINRSGAGYDFSAVVESTNTFEAEGTKRPEHFINIKVKHKSVITL